MLLLLLAIAVVLVSSKPLLVPHLPPVTADYPSHDLSSSVVCAGPLLVVPRPKGWQDPVGRRREVDFRGHSSTVFVSDGCDATNNEQLGYSFSCDSVITAMSSKEHRPAKRSISPQVTLDRDDLEF